MASIFSNNTADNTQPNSIFEIEGSIIHDPISNRMTNGNDAIKFKCSIFGSGSISSSTTFEKSAFSSNFDFVNRSLADYHINGGSDAVDYCGSTDMPFVGSLDVDGEGIPYDHTVNNIHGIFDLGVDEFHPVNNAVVDLSIFTISSAGPFNNQDPITTTHNITNFGPNSANNILAVSYTHLTLPTIYSV